MDEMTGIGGCSLVSNYPKTIQLPARKEPFGIFDLLERSRNRGQKGLVTSTSGAFDCAFVNCRQRLESAVDTRHVSIFSVSSETDHEFREKYRRNGGITQFVDVHHLLVAEADDPFSKVPAIGPVYFLMRDYSMLICLIELRHDGDGGWRLHYLPITHRPKNIQGYFAHRM